METREQRVQRGAAWLDRWAPGWDAAIDLTDFDIGRNDRCVLGQLIGVERSTAVAWLGETPVTQPERMYQAATDEARLAYRYGFAENRRAQGFDHDQAYGALTSVWRGVIARRRLGRIALHPELLAV